jgi:hypothetical protein
VTNEEPAHQRDRITLANAMRSPGCVVWPGKKREYSLFLTGRRVWRLRAQQTPVSFSASTPILLRDVHQAIENLCGTPGWTG